MTLFIDGISDVRQRSVAVLHLFPEERLPMVIQMLGGMAGVPIRGTGPDETDG